MNKVLAGLGQAWFRLTAYLPLLFMAVLAAATYALLQATPEPEELVPERELTSAPDFFMRGFSIRSFAQDGRLQTEMFGVEGRHRPDTDTLEIDQARIRSIDAKGAVTIATANRLNTNSDNNQFDLIGQAVVVRNAKNKQGKSTSPVRFESEYLRVYTEPSRLFSDQPVLIVRDNDRIVSKGLDYLGEKEQLVFQGRVKVELIPQPKATTD